MGQNIVLDASAVVAMFKGEAGTDFVSQYAEGAMMSTVNLIEVISRMIFHGYSHEKAIPLYQRLKIVILSLDERQAIFAGELRLPTKSFGLSLGDRVCLALAHLQKGTVLTSDKQLKLAGDHLNIPVTLFR